MNANTVKLLLEVALILAVILSIYGVVEMVLVWCKRIKNWRRRKQVDARIIRQAKAAEVWDKKPIVLGGRALELKAWQDFKIKREPGEPDAHLRRRYMQRYDEIMETLKKQISTAAQIPPEILCGGAKKNKQAKEETQSE